ncbi:helix-turn-helix domain-containing protein [Sphingobacterium thalpophilum]|uniref:Helix-turn-helix domain-containing protein n=1 Tax=Sphingobacterium thalpophilum TaxID=259 RepID=A0ACD5C0E2_9SPHI|nr:MULTISPECIES: helix-turn-helix domain-containing protein [Sphingobacterium]
MNYSHILFEKLVLSAGRFNISEPLYCILLFEKATSFSVDLVTYHADPKSVVFLSPYQLFTMDVVLKSTFSVLKFHGDFYCIEYHKDEVACNGILFNNIYQQPHVLLSAAIYHEISTIMEKIDQLKMSSESYDQSLSRTYLQLILALASRQKLLFNDVQKPSWAHRDIIDDFEQFLEKNYKAHKEVTFYAANYGLSPAVFTKKIKLKWGKSPSKLIQERLVLESKRQLHLTAKSIKEIAANLQYKDEFYFSRFFKKMVGVSPKVFRKRVGLSIVAEKSML